MKENKNYVSPQVEEIDLIAEGVLCASIVDWGIEEL